MNRIRHTDRQTIAKNTVKVTRRTAKIAATGTSLVAGLASGAGIAMFVVKYVGIRS